MKIHTTQDLNSLVQNRQSTTVPSKGFRLNYSQKPALNKERNLIAFKGGLPELVEKVAKDSNVSEKFTKMIASEKFRKVLDFMDHEVLVQAIISGVVCMLLRPLTILGISLFDEKSKGDNTYAATHSISSGLVGFFGTLLIAFPFSKGLQKKNLGKYVDKLVKNNKDLTKIKENLKELRPDLDLKTVFDESTGKVNDKELWRTVDGKKAPHSMKDVLTVARPTHYSECSEETFNKFGASVDLNSQKGKPLFNMVTKDGERVVDKLNVRDMFIAVKEKGMGGSINGAKDTNFFSLKFIDKDFLKKVDSTIDIKSIEKDGQRLHPNQWLREDGSKWLNEKTAESIHLPSFFETLESTPIYTGLRRPGDEKKYASYLDNIENYKLGDVPNELGTVITKEYLIADKLVDSKKKLVTWLPDIVTRPLVASSTIALIPWILKNVFHMEKHKHKDNSKVEANKPAETNQKTDNAEKVAFKGGLGDKIGEFYAKWYANSMFYNNSWLQKSANFISKAKGNMTEHMSALGSLITSSVYMYKTLTNDQLEKDNRGTLAINQGLCFAIPTYLAYKVNHTLSDKVKSVEYKFSGAMKGLVQQGKITDAEYKEFAKKLPNRIKNVKTLASLATFTLTYRYVTPVLITPIANLVGRIIRAHRENNKVKIASNK